MFGEKSTLVTINSKLVHKVIFKPLTLTPSKTSITKKVHAVYTDSTDI